MEYINHMVGICVTEKGENVRLDIYCNQGRYMERKTLRYRKEESALCDAALYGLLKRRTGDAPQDCVKGGIEPSPSLKEKSELCRCLSKTYMMGKRIGPFWCFKGMLSGRLGQRRPLSALLYDTEYGQIVIAACGPEVKTWYLFEGEAGADIGKNGMDNGYILSIWGMGKVLQKFFFKTIVSY